jgi:hypothetical protein
MPGRQHRLSCTRGNRWSYIGCAKKEITPMHSFVTSSPLPTALRYASGALYAPYWISNQRGDPALVVATTIRRPRGDQSDETEAAMLPLSERLV